MTTQLELMMPTTTTKAQTLHGAAKGASEPAIRARFAIRSDGTDWANRDEPHPDPASLLRVGSPRCRCNNGCDHVFSSESAFDRHLEMLANGDARCRPPAELRGFAKRPMARDVAGVWYTPGTAVADGEETV